jgi:hypothetical protein
MPRIEPDLSIDHSIVARFIDEILGTEGRPCEGHQSELGERLPHHSPFFGPVIFRPIRGGGEGGAIVKELHSLRNDV